MASQKKSDDELLKLARERWELANEADTAQRQREQADLRFYSGDQWDPLAKQARAGQPANASNGLPPVPARPCLTINKVREPVRQVLNNERQSDYGVEIVAADDFGGLVAPSEDVAREIELREGLVRRIQRTSEASDARSWAFTRSTIAGRGFWGVMTRYLPGKTFDQEVCIQRYFNQASVMLDPAHEQPDGSDADWGFVGVDMEWAAYKAEFPENARGKKNAILSMTDTDFRALGDQEPAWFRHEGETRMVRVVDYWYINRDARTLCLLPDGSSAWKDELPEGVKPVDTRDVIEKQVQWCKIDGAQILQETDWQGPDIPIVKVLGEELQPFDNERRTEGMVRPARDAQEGFNALISKWVETIGLAPIPPFIVQEGTVEDYKAWYQAASTRTLPYLPFKGTDLAGNPAQPPTRPSAVDGTFIQALGASVQLFDASIKDTTGIPDAMLGKVDPSVRSGRAVDLLRKQGQQGTGHFLDNLKRSIRYEGQIVNNLLYPIYGTKPGRLARIVNGQGESETVTIGQPVQPMGQPAPPMGAPGMAPPPMGAPGLPPSGAPPMGAAPPPGMPGQPPMAPGAPPPAPAPPKPFVLTKDASFNVIIKVTRSFESRRDEEADLIATVLQADPKAMSIYGDLFFKNQDGPGHQEMAERARVMLVPPVQAMLADKESGQQPVPPIYKGQIDQLKQQLEDAHKILQKFAAEQQGKQAELDNKLQIETMARDKELQLQIMRDATAIEVAKLNLLAKGITAQGIAEDEAIAEHESMAHEAAQNAMDRAHDSAMAAQSAQHGQDAAAQIAQQQPPPNGQSPEGQVPPGAPPA